MSLASGRSLAARWSVLCACACAPASARLEDLLTRLRNADSDVSALELAAGEGEGLLQAVNRAELDVSESLGLAVELVLDDAHVGDLAVAEEVVDITLSGVEGEVAQVGCVRGLRGEGQLLASSKAALGCGTLLACAQHRTYLTKQERTKAVGAAGAECAAAAVRRPLAAAAVAGATIATYRCVSMQSGKKSRAAGAVMGVYLCLQTSVQLRQRGFLGRYLRGIGASSISSAHDPRATRGSVVCASSERAGGAYIGRLGSLPGTSSRLSCSWALRSSSAMGPAI
jgi:hypothetical protein